MKKHSCRSNTGKIHGIKRMYKIKHRKVRDDLEEVFSDYKIVEVIKVTSNKQYGLDFMERIVDVESYQIKINLIAPTLTFLGIEACNPFSIVDKPTVGLIYLNNKEEKRIMDLVDIAKFCDATLKKSLRK
ncbi:hypothetical protein Tco_1239326 [Tanacetum coccineum]